MDRVKSGIFGQTAKFGQQPCLFHILNIGIENKLTKQAVKILMRRLIRNRLIWIYTVCKCVSEFTRLYPSDILQNDIKMLVLSVQGSNLADCQLAFFRKWNFWLLAK